MEMPRKNMQIIPPMTNDYALGIPKALGRHGGASDGTTALFPFLQQLKTHACSMDSLADHKCIITGLKMKGSILGSDSVPYAATKSTWSLCFGNR